MGGEAQLKGKIGLDHPGGDQRRQAAEHGGAEFGGLRHGHVVSVTKGCIRGGGWSLTWVMMSVCLEPSGRAP
jgi:hypothetical protein